MESKKYSLNKEDIKSIGRGLFDAVMGVVLAAGSMAALDYLDTVLSNFDWSFNPTIGLMVMGVWVVAVKAGRKYFGGK